MLNSFGNTFKHPPSAKVVHTLSVNLETLLEESLCLPDFATLVAVKLVMVDGSIYARAVVSAIPSCA